MRQPFWRGTLSWDEANGKPSIRATRRLRFDRPAEDWLGALPIGNGRIGAMAYGGTARERLVLNHIELWSGRTVAADREETRLALPRVRDLLFQGRYAEANTLAQNQMMAPMNDANFGSYQMLGELSLDFDHAGTVSDYRRELVAPPGQTVSHVSGTPYAGGRTRFIAGRT